MKTGTKVKMIIEILIIVLVNQVLSQECPADRFTCDKHKCIPKKWVCDGTPDCSDGTDELECGDQPVTCMGTQFLCENNNKCIPQIWKCDGFDDCGDNSDEKSEICKNQCGDFEFSCGDGICIDNGWICDGRIDCNDGSDEKNCSSEAKKPPFNRFLCGSGNSIPKRWVCDGLGDCEDDSDEKNCPEEDNTTSLPVSSCLPDEFKCNNSFCISNTWRCNGLKDCLNGEDEVGCSARACDSNEFQCTAGNCFREWYRCDGVKDCEDGSDEVNCTKPAQPTTTPPAEFTCNSTHSFLCSGTFCISTQQLCDGKQDCPNNKDESENECGYNECHRNNGGCEHNCINTKIGYHCTCDKGFRSSGKYNCKDINECEEIPGICSQTCTNYPGGFRCSCLEGYMRDPGNVTRCRAVQGEVLLLFSHSFDIRQLRLRDQEMKSVIGDTRNAIALDYSYADGNIFWSQKRDKKILRSNLNRTMEREVILNQHDVSADGLAVDWIHKTLYFTDNFKQTVYLASFNGKLVKTLVQEDLSHPRAIVVSPLAGYIYWTDWGHEPKIERAELDGSNRIALITSQQHVRWPNGLTIDHPSERLFWCDGLLKTIFSSDLNGHNVEAVVHSTDYLNHPFSITVFEDRLYWTDWSNVALISANKFTGSGLNTVSAGHLLEAPRVVHVYHEFRQPTGENVCEKIKCDHFCLRNAGNQPFCTCADGYLLDEDSVSCNLEKANTEVTTDNSPEIPSTDVPDTIPEKIISASASPVRCIKSSNSLEVLDVEIVESRSLCEEEEDSFNLSYVITGSLIGFVVVALFVMGVVYWGRSNNPRMPFQRIFFPNPVYRRTTEEYPDGRGLIIGQERMFYKPTEDHCNEQILTDADDVPLAPKSDAIV